MDIDKLESAARKAWPALDEVESHYGVLRYAAGVSRRANSFTPSLAGMNDPIQSRALSESFFFPRGLPSTVRVIAASGWAEPESCSLDQCLATASYQKVAPAAVLLKPLGDGQRSVCDQPAGASLAQWLQAWYAVKNLPATDFATDFATHELMLGSITDCHLLLVARDASGAARATALGVISDGLLGIYGVATESTARRQGLAAALIARLFAWARGNGARSAYLQVEADNYPAMALYRKLGFENSYTYWYRCKPPTNVDRSPGLESQPPALLQMAEREPPCGTDHHTDHSTDHGTHYEIHDANHRQGQRRHFLDQAQEGQQYEHY